MCFVDLKYNYLSVLVGDTSSSTLLSAYPQMATQFPNNIACIFIRNTSATDSSDKLPYDTSPFKNVTNGTYFFYNTADDLFNLNVTNGECVNASVPQNVQFGEQGGPLGGSSAAAKLSLSVAWTWIMPACAAALLGLGAL